MSRYLPMIGLVLAIMFVGCAKQPEYQGVSLKRWIQQLNAGDQTLRAEAAQAIGAIGKIAREPSEPTLRQIAFYDPIPAVRVAAILALKAIGAPSAEFEAYLKEVTQPLTDEVNDDEALMGQGDEDFTTEKSDEELRTRASSSSDDLEFLQTLEAMKDSVIQTSNDAVMPTDEDEKKLWVEKRKNEAIATLMQELQNPDVLAEMVKSGDPLQRRLAARMLENQDGGVNPRVFEILNSAKADTDTVLKRLAQDALKKWTNE